MVRSMSDTEGRLEAVETVVGQLDRDSADMKSALRTYTSLVQSLRETQLDMQRTLDSQARALGAQGLALGELLGLWTRASDRLTSIDRRQGRVDDRQDRMDRRQDRMETRLGGIDGRLDGIDGRLDRMDARFDGVDGTLQEILRRLPATG
jgi:chromosome segregation ATPase